MKTPYIIVTLSCLLLGLSACNSSRLTYDDVTRELEEAKNAKEEVKEEMQEAINAREQYYTDYKLSKIEELEKNMKSLDKQISSIEKQLSKTKNEEARENLNAAIDNLKAEKGAYKEQITELNNMSPKSWQDSRSQLNESLEEIEIEIKELDKSLEGYEEK